MNVVFHVSFPMKNAADSPLQLDTLLSVRVQTKNSAYVITVGRTGRFDKHRHHSITTTAPLYFEFSPWIGID